jgi:hypothetical protein
LENSIAILCSKSFPDLLLAFTKWRYLPCQVYEGKPAGDIVEGKKRHGLQHCKNINYYEMNPY